MSLEKKKLKNKHESAILLEWDNLRQLLWSNNCIVSPGKFIKTIQKLAQIKDMELFTGYSQNDLPEFLLFVIDCFHNSLSREIKMTISGAVENETDTVAVKCFEMVKNMYSKEYSEVWNLFYAVHVSEISKLETGERIKITPEPYFMIDLPIPENNKNPTLIDCFEHYVEGETLEGENAWLNDETKQKINIKKRIQFWSFPDILVIDFKRFREIADKVGAYLMVDMAHFSGLVAGKGYPNPCDHAHVVTSTTHKVFRSARGGIILTNHEDLAKKFNTAVFPGYQGGPLMHVIAAKAAGFLEALQPEFKDYIQSVLANAKMLAETLKNNGFKIYSDGTDTHLMLVDLRPYNIKGNLAAESLSRANITCNKNGIPFDTEKPMITSGIRLGTQAATTRGFGLNEFKNVRVGTVVACAAGSGADTSVLKQITNDVVSLETDQESIKSFFK